MLSQKATDLNIALCEKIEGSNFVIMSWEDIFGVLLEEKPDDNTCRQLFEELRLNACVTLKYKDEEQACFAMTDKARLIAEEIKALVEVEENKETMIKTDENGHAMFVVPKTKMALENISKSKKESSMKSFLAGMLGGVLGGAIIYAIMYVVELFI